MHPVPLLYDGIIISVTVCSGLCACRAPGASFCTINYQNSKHARLLREEMPKEPLVGRRLLRLAFATHPRLATGVSAVQLLRSWPARFLKYVPFLLANSKIYRYVDVFVVSVVVVIVAT